uniref:Homeobox D10 n=1 Tax=Gallus gallus TaxID=9031 RepID=A0A8V1A1B2_CHICK
MSFPNSSPAANTFLVDSLISACRSDSFYSNSASMYMPPSTDIGTYGMQTCGLLPSLAKREVNHQNMGMNVHPYIPQVDSWTDPNRSCRIEQPVTQQVPTCSFTTNIKEESNCCMYSDKRTKLISSDVPSYQRLVSESCPIENPEVPVPGYFRLSQTYATGKTQEYNNSPETSSTVMLQLNPRGSSKPQLSSQLQMEKKMNENPNGQDGAAKVSQVESPEPKSTLQDERSCLPEGSVSSPEVQEKETKEVLAASPEEFSSGNSFPGPTPSAPRTQKERRFAPARTDPYVCGRAARHAPAARGVTEETETQRKGESEMGKAEQ